MAMSEPRDTEQKGPPTTSADMWAQRRGKNYAILAAIVGLAVLFFVITILRMS